MAEPQQQFWSDFDSNSSRLGSAASFFGDSMSHSSGFLTENSSLFSMTEDDFDHLATLKAKEMFEEVDRALYENCNPVSFEVARECQEWKSKFPHLRIIGRKMLESNDYGFKRYSPADMLSNVSSLNNNKHATKGFMSGDLINGLSVKGERVESNGHVPKLNLGREDEEEEEEEEEEEVIDRDGDYEEIFAVDYNSDEKRSTLSTFRGYPPVTPINSFKDSVVHSLCGEVVKSFSSVVDDLVLECRKRQTTSPSNDERARVKEDSESGDQKFDASTDEAAVASATPEPFLTRSKIDGETPAASQQVVSNRNFSFKSTDLQVVPEDFGLDVTPGRKFRNERNGEDLPSPSRHNVQSSRYSPNHGDATNRVLHLSDNFRQKCSLVPLSSVPEAEVQQQTSKGAESGKTSTQNSQGMQSKQKQPLPRIQQRSHVASNGGASRSVQLHGRATKRITSASHSSRDQSSSKQFLGSNLKFGGRPSLNHEPNRPSSTRTYYNSKIESRHRIHSPPLNSSRSSVVLPELVDQKNGADLTGVNQGARDATLKAQTSKQAAAAASKKSPPTTMPHIHDSHAGPRRSTLPSKSRINSVPHH